jgi:hypothetical protein
MNLSPDQMLVKTTAYAQELAKAMKSSVKVGLPKEKASGKVYDNGMNVISIGAIHEYGAGVPRRSFLRVPFRIKRDTMDEAIETQFRDVAKGKPLDVALGLVGVEAVNIVKDAFVTQGYGTWPTNAPETIEQKGSSRPLIDTRLLSRSITWVVES